MGRIEELSAAYEQHISAPWPRTVAGAQRVIFAIYEKELERTLRARVAEFEQATERSGHKWKMIDCTDWFAKWLSDDEYHEAYFEDPSLLEMKLEGEFRPAIAEQLIEALEANDENTIVAVLGVASLYGFTRVSEFVQSVDRSIRGRLLIFFPGTKDGQNYRLLDARDGWNYLATAITIHGGGRVE